VSGETTRSPSLWNAIQDRQEADDAAEQEARRPEHEAYEQALAADAKLYGTAGWDALPPARRMQVSAWAAQQTQSSGDAA
jgi:hypothetical protein